MGWVRTRVSGLLRLCEALPEAATLDNIIQIWDIERRRSGGC